MMIVELYRAPGASSETLAAVHAASLIRSLTDAQLVALAEARGWDVMVDEQFALLAEEMAEEFGREDVQR